MDAGELLARALPHHDVGEDVVVISAGKAAPAMAAAAASWYGSRVREGLIVGPRTVDAAPPRFAQSPGGHPLPTAGSERAGKSALALARGLSRDETLVVLLSGGASALLAIPAHGVSLEDKRIATSILLRSGVGIDALNTVRKHLSAIKGGQLAAATRARCLTLAVSDVVGDDLSVIASGPTVADSTWARDALRILRGVAPDEAFPRSVVRHLERISVDTTLDTPKPGDARLLRAEAYVIGNARVAIDAAVREAQRLGYHSLGVSDPIVGEAKVAGAGYLSRALAHAGHLPRPLCIVSAGETTVTVTGDGRGGRNQELALGAVEHLADSHEAVALASIGTDGIDGPTDAAGAIADEATFSRATALGLARPDAFLHNNNAYSFFDALGDLVRSGPTAANVGDLQVLLIG